MNPCRMGRRGKDLAMATETCMANPYSLSSLLPPLSLSLSAFNQPTREEVDRRPSCQATERERDGRKIAVLPSERSNLRDDIQYFGKNRSIVVKCRILKQYGIGIMMVGLNTRFLITGCLWIVTSKAPTSVCTTCI